MRVRLPAVHHPAERDDPFTRHYIGDDPSGREAVSWLDYSAYRRFARSGLGYRSEIHPRFYRLTPSIITIAAMVVSMLLLANAMKTLPAGTAYAVWTGIGAVGAAIMGMVLLGESTNIARIISLCLIVVGILGLKFSSH